MHTYIGKHVCTYTCIYLFQGSFLPSHGICVCPFSTVRALLTPLEPHQRISLLAQCHSVSESFIIALPSPLQQKQLKEVKISFAFSPQHLSPHRTVQNPGDLQTTLCSEVLSLFCLLHLLSVSFPLKDDRIPLLRCPFRFRGFPFLFLSI